MHKFTKKKDDESWLLALKIQSDCSSERVRARVFLFGVSFRRHTGTFFYFSHVQGHLFFDPANSPEGSVHV